MTLRHRTRTGSEDSVEITVARKRLEEMRDDLDRTMRYCTATTRLWQARVPQESADAGANLSEADRTEAILDSARSQRDGCSPRSRASTTAATGSASTAATRFPRAGSRPGPAARCVPCQSKYAKRR